MNMKLKHQKGREHAHQCRLFRLRFEVSSERDARRQNVSLSGCRLRSTDHGAGFIADPRREHLEEKTRLPSEESRTSFRRFGADARAAGRWGLGAAGPCRRRSLAAFFASSEESVGAFRGMTSE